MNVSLLLIITLVGFGLGYKYYGGFMSKLFGEDDNNITPAIQYEDGVDYVPTKPLVVFSHQFASIAGAGPIVGPTTAMLYGYMPVWMWVLFGAIFIGAVHDYTALFVSMREKGKSVAEVSYHTMGKGGFILFISFTIVMIVLVTSAFLGLTATSLTSLVPLENMNIASGETMLKTVMVDGVEMAKIGGIASTSVIIISMCAPFIGFLLYKKKLNPLIAAAIAIILCVVSVMIGVANPLMLQPKTWMIILTFYVILAAGIPVWVVLQPRDFTNSFMLYGGIAMLMLGILGGGFGGMTMSSPAFNVAGGTKIAGAIWPFLFITVACGAISGFHSLVSGGTVSKQAMKESQAKTIGYGAMLLEGILAVVVIITVSSGISFDTYMNIVYPAKGASNPILAFSLSMGGMLHHGIGLPIAFGTVFGILMVEGFVITTLDTAVRLNRYLFEELWGVIFKEVPALLKNFWFNSALSAGLMFYLGYTNAYTVIWPIFGSANQLLAALVLITVSVWLASRGKKFSFTMIPAVFMMVTTLMALWTLLTTRYLPKANYPLSLTAILLMALSVGVIYLAVKKISEAKKKADTDIKA